ncbi:E3 ubiquitin-protein ligase hrd1 [Lodderomyces elongisporus]|uniref:E3 ubiquitin-protein ligase hrd1 n=1 Tax=Lodderomyces elongisporus TaxID=36914 RepID=UPI0029253521|nr:E3 ubiquitin-protein ligase hrd1 [Lodderomyces elongisporus]WLF79174.1 E3 ubiquitin-protein ligase hrd1 [Lodderomyces elongisporus]
MNKTTQYIIGYSAVSVALLSWSIHDSLAKSYNYTMFIIEFTEGLKLGIFVNFVIFVFLALNKLLQLLFFGTLRIIEVEHLYEKLPIFVSNLFLNLATGDSNVILNVFLVGVAMTFKVMHIIMLDRLDLLNLQIFNKVNAEEDEDEDEDEEDGAVGEEHQQVARIGVWDIFKHYLSSINFWLKICFIVVDFGLAKLLVYDVFQGINSVTCLLFGFQFAVQGVETLTQFAKMLLGIYEIVFFKIRKNSRINHLQSQSSSRANQVDHEAGREGIRDEEDEEREMEELDAEETTTEIDDNDNDVVDEDEDEDDENEVDIVWESKPYYSKAIEISSALLTAMAYLCFIYLFTFHSGYSLPLSMLSGTFSSLKRAWTQTSQLLAFIESSKRLDTQLPSATKDDLESLDNLCIICREDMYSAEEYQRMRNKPQSPRRRAKKLPCNHILHMGCLKEWMERSDCCPLCRRKVFGGPISSTHPSFQQQANQAQPQGQPQGQPQPPQPQPVARPVAPLPTGFPTNAFHTNGAPPTNNDGRDMHQEHSQGRINNQWNDDGNMNQMDPMEQNLTSAARQTQTQTQSSTSSSSSSESPTYNVSLEPTRTTQLSSSLSSASSSAESIYQTLRLPRSALLPPDWTVIPLERVEGSDGDYRVRISPQVSANMKVRRPGNDTFMNEQ